LPDDLTDALLSNERLYDGLLTKLYEGGEPFASLPDDRWQRRVWRSARNPRLVTHWQSADGPDLGHMDIQKAIFRLLEIAPATDLWLTALDNLLEALVPPQVAVPDPGRIGAVLERWAAVVDTRNYKGVPIRLLHSAHARR
jgi:hypothetical protein